MLEREMRRAEQRINGINPNSMPIDTVTKGTEIKERVYRLFDGQAEMMEFKAETVQREDLSLIRRPFRHVNVGCAASVRWPAGCQSQSVSQFRLQNGARELAKNKPIAHSSMPI